MIQADRLTAALRAVHATLTTGEALARERGETQFAAFLNGAEYLPAMMLDRTDSTDRFERHLLVWARDDVVGRAALNAYNRELGRPQVSREELDAEPTYRPHPDSDPRDPFPLRWVRVDADGTTEEVDPEQALGPDRVAAMREARDHLASLSAPARKDAA